MAGLCLPVKVSGRPAVGEAIAMRRVQASEHTTDSHNTNSTCARSSPHLCTINFNKGWTVLHIDGQMSDQRSEWRLATAAGMRLC